MDAIEIESLAAQLVQDTGPDVLKIAARVGVRVEVLRGAGAGLLCDNVILRSEEHTERDADLAAACLLAPRSQLLSVTEWNVSRLSNKLGVPKLMVAIRLAMVHTGTCALVDESGVHMLVGDRLRAQVGGVWRLPNGILVLQEHET